MHPRSSLNLNDFRECYTWQVKADKNTSLSFSPPQEALGIPLETLSSPSPENMLRQRQTTTG